MLEDTIEKEISSPDSHTKDFQVCLEAANTGDAAKQYALAEHYFNGYSTSVDYANALYWYIKSANHNVSDAQYKIGMMCEEGLGIDANIKRAMLWYNRAVDNNCHADALYSLGILHLEGKQVPRNIAKGHMYLNLALLQGKTEAEQIIKQIESTLTTSEREYAFSLAREFIAKKKLRKEKNILTQ